jgi:hypothetical protein
MMRWIANENVSGTVIRTLRDRGHDVLSVKESLRGTGDPHILDREKGTGTSRTRSQSPWPFRVTRCAAEGEAKGDRHLADSEPVPFCRLQRVSSPVAGTATAQGP